MGMYETNPVFHFRRQLWTVRRNSTGPVLVGLSRLAENKAPSRVGSLHSSFGPHPGYSANAAYDANTALALMDAGRFGDARAVMEYIVANARCVERRKPDWDDVPAEFWNRLPTSEIPYNARKEWTDREDAAAGAALEEYFRHCGLDGQASKPIER